MKLLKNMLILCSLAATGALFATGQAAQQSQDPNEPGKIYQEVDQTDIYAIPLDDDELEEEQEMKEMEKIQNKNQKAAKPAPKN